MWIMVSLPMNISTVFQRLLLSVEFSYCTMLSGNESFSVYWISILKDKMVILLFAGKIPFYKFSWWWLLYRTMCVSGRKKKKERKNTRSCLLLWGGWVFTILNYVIIMNQLMFRNSVKKFQHIYVCARK